MEILTLHRMRLNTSNGKQAFEEIPVNPNNPDNFDIHYRFSITRTGETQAKAYGWGTGRPLYSPCDTGHEGIVYAPQGFGKGKVVSVQMDNITSDKRNVRKGFSLIGKVI